MLAPRWAKPIVVGRCAARLLHLLCSRFSFRQHQQGRSQRPLGAQALYLIVSLTPLDKFLSLGLIPQRCPVHYDYLFLDLS